MGLVGIVARMARGKLAGPRAPQPWRWSSLISALLVSPISANFHNDENEVTHPALHHSLYFPAQTPSPTFTLISDSVPLTQPIQPKDPLELFAQFSFFEAIPPPRAFVWEQQAKEVFSEFRGKGSMMVEP